MFRNGFRSSSRALNAVHPSRVNLSTRTIQIGAIFEEYRIFSSHDVANFLAVTGDTNRIHTEKGAALAAGLEDVILPGMLCASLFPAVIAKNFPGAIYLSQQLKFRSYAKVEEEVCAKVTATHISGHHVNFNTVCYALHGRILIDGFALAKLS